MQVITDPYLPDTPQWSPVMKTGNTQSRRPITSVVFSLNGARS